MISNIVVPEIVIYLTNKPFTPGPPPPLSSALAPRCRRTAQAPAPLPGQALAMFGLGDASQVKVEAREAVGAVQPTAVVAELRRHGSAVDLRRHDSCVRDG